MIYILKLEKNKYYIGKTNNIDKRYQQHLNGNGSEWTKLYKPLHIITTIESSSEFDEDKYVKIYMSKYGIENVRGGTYVSIELEENSLFSLQKEIWHSKNLCTRCGRNSHFVKQCYAKKDINGNSLDENSSSSENEVYECEYCNKEYESEYLCEKHEKYCKKRPCDICGKKGHKEINCFFG